MNGTNMPETIAELSRKKTVTLFVDGDRGGSLITKEVTERAEIDFVAKAPDGKEVEEITKKEIHNALRAKISAEQAKFEMTKENGQEKARQFPGSRFQAQPQSQQRPLVQRPQPSMPQQSVAQRPVRRIEMTGEEKKVFGEMLENLVGTRGAQLLDQKLNVLGKVPITELESTVKSLGKGIHAIVFDGVIEPELVHTAERSDVRYLIGMDTKVKQSETRIGIFTVGQLD